MKIALAQLNFIMGDFEYNFQKIRRAIDQAVQAGADIVCFSELAVCGYPPRDYLEFYDFIQRSKQIIDRLCRLSHEIAIVVGAPTTNPVPEGKDLFNSLLFLHEGRLQYVQHKTLLPTYDIFDDYRYFEPNVDFGIVDFKGYRIALTICEDIWNVGEENPLYTVDPVERLAAYKPDVLINASASPFDYRHMQERIRVIRRILERHALPVFYVNQVGANTDLIFDGGSLIFSPDGQMFDCMALFEEDLRVYELEQVRKGRSYSLDTPSEIELIHRALVLGIRDYFDKTGLKEAIVGLSGGIDSSVTAALAVEALGADRVVGVLMPSQYSSQHSVDDARALCANLGMRCHQISIQRPFEVIKEVLAPYVGGRVGGITEENLQPRLRMIYLMALANHYGYVLLNTSNKSELAVGYGTLYGDLAGGLSVLGDVYKTQVYELARHINRRGTIIPPRVLTKPPSAELRPEQKDTDSLPPYEILDPVLYQYIEERKSPHQIESKALTGRQIVEVLKRVNINEFKRHQTAPVLRVSPKAFGLGRRIPIVGRYLW